jgi:hypothetical protein
MSSGEGRSARRLDYVVTQTLLRAEEYGRAALPLVRELGFGEEDYRRAGGVRVIRCTAMNPFLAARRGKVDFIQGFTRTLGEVMRGALPPSVDPACAED